PSLDCMGIFQTGVHTLRSVAQMLYEIHATVRGVSATERQRLHAFFFLGFFFSRFGFSPLPISRVCHDFSCELNHMIGALHRHPVEAETASSMRFCAQEL